LLSGSRLLGDDLVSDFLIGGERNDLLARQISLFGVGAAVDNFLGVSVADAWKLLSLRESCAIEID